MFLRHRWACSDRVAVARTHRANGDFDADRGHRSRRRSVDASPSTLRDRIEAQWQCAARGARAIGDARRAGVAQVRIAAGASLGHFAVVQGLVWRAIGMSEAARSCGSAGIRWQRGSLRLRYGLGRIGAARGASRARCGVADDCRPLPCRLEPNAEIESFMPWVDAAASRHARAHLRLFAN